MKIQRKILLIFRTDFIFALISRHFIGLTRHFRLWKVMPQIKELLSNKFNEIELKFKNFIFILNFYGFFYIIIFIWGITFHNLKYLDKPIKCLEMRAEIKSVRFYEIFLVISHIFKNRTFFPHSSILTPVSFTQ